MAQRGNLRLSFDLSPSERAELTRERSRDRFITGVFADLSGTAGMASLPPFEMRRFEDLDIDNFSAFLAAQQPRVRFIVRNAVTGAGDLDIDLAFSRMEDFRPEALAQRLAPLSELMEARRELEPFLRHGRGARAASAVLEALPRKSAALRDIVELAAAAPDTESRAAPGGLSADEEKNPSAGARSFEELLNQKSPGEARPQAPREKAEQAVQELVRDALARSGAPSGETEQTLQRIAGVIAAIDCRLSEQLDLVLHHPEFRRLEGAWLGLEYLIKQTETGPDLKIRALNISKEDLAAGLHPQPGHDFSSTWLYDLLYEQPCCTPGGEPFTCLLADYEFGAGEDDLAILTSLARILASCGARCAAGAAPSLCGLETWADLREMREPGAPLTLASRAAWNELRAAQSMDRIHLAAPQLLARLPYGKEAEPVESFPFEEDRGDGTTRLPCSWANAAYAYGVICHRAFVAEETTDAVPDPGIEDLPGSLINQPTEVVLSDRQLKDLAGAGLMPLMFNPSSGMVRFLSLDPLGRRS